MDDCLFDVTVAHKTFFLTIEMWIEVIGTTSQQKLSHIVFQSSFLSLCHFVQLKALNGRHQVNSEISAVVMVMIVIKS